LGVAGDGDGVDSVWQREGTELLVSDELYRGLHEPWLAFLRKIGNVAIVNELLSRRMRIR